VDPSPQDFCFMPSWAGQRRSRGSIFSSGKKHIPTQQRPGGKAVWAWS